MDADKGTPQFATISKDIGDAVGMEECQWYVAVVNNNCEKKISKNLDREHIENYVPIQAEIRVRKDGKKVKVDRVVIPSMVFIRCTERQRLDIVRLPYIKRFMTNKAGGGTQSVKPVAVIPDDQIVRLKFVLGHSEEPVVFGSPEYRSGDRVRVMRGCLAGLVCEVMNVKPGKTELIVNLDYFGCIRVSIDRANLELLPKINKTN